MKKGENKMHTETNYTNYTVRKFLVILVAAIMIFSLFSAMELPAYAATAQGSGYKITSSSGPISQIRKNDVITVRVSILVPGGAGTITASDVSRAADGFSDGTISVDSTTGDTLVVDITGLKYKGGAKELNLFVKNPTSGNYEEVSFTITECYSTEESKADAAASNAAWEANKPQVKTYSKPTIIFSRGDLAGNIAAKETKTISVSAKNTGKRAITNVVLSVSTSDELMIKDPQTSYEIGTIAQGASATKEIKVKAFDKIVSQNQYLDVTLTYDYVSNSDNETASATDSFKISVPATVTKEVKDEDDKKTEAPVPNLIITGFDYGGSSVAANSSFNLSMSVKNTSKKIAVENVVATVDAGTDFSINGGINTFYFEKIGANSSKSISVPLKVVPSITMSANTVSVSMTYEYVDNKVRKQGTASLKVSVPVYQPDKFKIDAPTVPSDATVGMETTIMVNYVNKGKTAISNVAAKVSGDIFTERDNQVVGNIEPGKNGTIVFAVTPNNPGENAVKIKVTYEDSNGNTKKRVFNVTMNAMDFVMPEYPDEDPGFEEPEMNTGKILGLPKWIFFVIIAVAFIVALVVLKKLRKKAKLKKQEALWAKWDEEESTKEIAAESTAESGESK